MDPAYRDEPLRDHDRSAFHCGVEALDHYFRHQAGQDRRRKLAAAYVMREPATGRIAGFYTLSAFTISAASMAADVARRLPAYETYPAILIGRFAVDRHFQGKGIGRRLLASALRRCLALSEQLGAIAVVVDAKDATARTFYEHEGLLRLEDHDNRLYVPMRTIARIVRA